MASGDYADLQLNLARMLGRPAFAQLDDEDQALAKQVINEAYLECYAPVDGRHPPWAKRLIGLRFRSPVTAAINVNQGSKVVTGYAFGADMAGSIVKLGSNYYTYAGNDGSHKFVEPVDETTGAYQVTIYHSSFVLDADVNEVERAPELVGFGPLSPMASREEESAHRASFRGDFEPLPGSGGFPLGSRLFSGSTYEIGRPVFYRIEGIPLLNPADLQAPAQNAEAAAGLSATITSLADLAAIVTVGLAVPAIRVFVNADTGALEVWRLLASNVATDGVSSQRPNDYAAGTNEKVWFKAST